MSQPLPDSRRRLAWILSLLIALAIPLGAWLAWSARGNAEEEVSRLVYLLELEPGMSAAEVGAGKGAMTAAMARRLAPHGKMFSTDLEPDRVADIREAVEEAGVENVQVLEGRKSVAGLPASCCDAIFMSKVYHHFTDPETMNASFFDSLRPGGRIAVIDFEPAGWQIWLRHPSGVPENRGGHGMPPDLLIQELKAAGFTIEHEIADWWGGPFGRYCVIARKPLGGCGDGKPSSGGSETLPRRLNWFCALAGVPALTHGPNATGAHSVNECCPISELVRVAQVFALTALAYCAEDAGRA